MSNKEWLLLDAKDKIVGRLATKVASILIGKNKSDYTPGCCLLYTSPSPRDRTRSRMPSSA